MKFLHLLVLGLAVLPASAGTKLLVKNGLFLTISEKNKEPFLGYMTVGSDGKILAVEAGTPPASIKADTTYDAGGKFISPGFISSHSHIWQSCFRGVGADGTLFDWIASFSTYTTRGTDEDFYNWTLHGCLDFIRYGVTSAYNFTNAGSQWTGYNSKPQPYRPGRFEEKQFQAELESGLRFTHSFNVSLVYSDEERRARIQGLIDYAKPHATNPRFLKFAVSGGTAFATTKDQAFMEARVMKEFGFDNQSHFLEPPNGLDQQQKIWWLKEAGIFDSRQTFGHFIHTTPEIVAATAKNGSKVSWQPLSNGRLASGVCDVPTLLKAGIPVGMGLDDQNASDVPDPYENMRMGLYIIRAKYENAKILSPYDVLKLHTLGGATVMGVADKVGSLEPGKYADFVVTDPKLRDTGPVHDPYAHLVLACTQMNLERVYIGGDLKSNRGELVGVDFNKVSAKAYASTARVKAEAQEALRSKLSK